MYGMIQSSSFSSQLAPPISPGLLPPRAAHARLRAARRRGQGRGRGGRAGAELPMHGAWDETRSAMEKCGDVTTPKWAVSQKGW